MLLCPVCKSDQTYLWSSAKDYEYFTSNKEYYYYSCRNCDTIFIDPIPENELKSIYPFNYYSFVETSKNIVTKIKEWLDKRFLRKILLELRNNEIKVLDVGGGTGWLSDLIKRIDSRVILTQIVDIDSKAGILAEKKGHSYFQGILEDFNTIEKYDLILMLNLIEHVSDPLKVINKAASLLTNNGIILIKTPNTKSLDARLFQKSYWGGLHCPRHWVIFSEKSFRLMVQETELTIDSLYYTQGGPFWAFSIISWLHKKNWIHVSAQRPVIFHSLFPFLSALTSAFDFVRRPFSKTSQMFILLNRLDKKMV